MMPAYRQAGRVPKQYLNAVQIRPVLITILTNYLPHNACPNRYAFACESLRAGKERRLFQKDALRKNA